MMGLHFQKICIDMEPAGLKMTITKYQPSGPKSMITLLKTTNTNIFGQSFIKGKLQTYTCI